MSIRDELEAMTDKLRGIREDNQKKHGYRSPATKEKRRASSATKRDGKPIKKARFKW